MKKLMFLLMPLIMGSACQGQEPEAHVDVEKASEMIADNKVVVLDVRTPEEYEEGYIDEARLMNFYEEDFEQQLGKLPKDETYIVYCHSGNRSGKAVSKMKQMGFEEVYNLEGGIMSWQEKGEDLEK